MRPNFAAILLCAAALPAIPQTPIRVTTRAVGVSVVVRDKNGHVAGLTREDFTLLDQGKPQKITGFSVQAIPAQQAAVANAAPASPLPPHIYSNRPETKAAVPSNTTVVLLDALNTLIRDQHYVKQQFLQFLKQIQPTDRIAVYSLGTKLTVLHEFTSDASRLVASVRKYSGDNLSAVDASNPTPSDSGDPIVDSWLNDSAGIVSDIAIANRVTITAAALEAIAQHIARLPGRKNLVWISGSFPLSIGHLAADGANNWEDAAFDQKIATGGRGRTSGGATSGGASEDSSAYEMNVRDGNPARDNTSFQRDLLRATRALSDADIAVYPVDARGLIAQPKNMTAEGTTSVSRSMVTAPVVSQSLVPTGRAAMEVVAENTGGLVFENTNDIRGAIRSAIDDGLVTYTLVFSPDPATLNGRFHPLKVQVKRPGIEIRYRKGYLALADAEPEAKDRSAAMRDAVASPIEALGIVLTAGVESDQPKPGSIRVTLAIDPKDVAFSEVGGKFAAGLDVTYSLRAADGHELASSAQGLNLNLPPAQYEAVMKEGMTVTRAIENKPALAEIRIAVYDRATGKTGSIILPAK